MLMMAGWDGSTDFIDPMCGSGTLPIEAALIALNIAPGVFRKGFAFEKWPDFDKELFESIYNDDSQEREFNHHVYGYDIKNQAVEIATRNVKAAGLSKYVTIMQQDIADFEEPREKALMVTNPPYGERISSPDLLGLYKTIGERLKHEFKGNDAWILSYRKECFDEIGLKASTRIPLFNGALECEFRKYQMFDGKMSDFRGEGGDIKTDEERRRNRERKFRAKRDFNRRDDDNQEETEGVHGHHLRGRDKDSFRPRKLRYNSEEGGDRKFSRNKDRKGGFDRKGKSDFKRGGGFKKDFKKDFKRGDRKSFGRGREDED
jgi:putative N6-adenine-specific DNA methylase